MAPKIQAARTAILPFPKSSKGGAIYETLKRLIMLGALPPGEAVGELKLAGQFGCSQGPVREALLRLQEDGLVNRTGYRGTYVSRITDAEAAEMFHLRREIECRAVAPAMSRLDDDVLDALAARIAEMEDAARAGDEYLLSELDRDFHLSAFRLARLPALEPILLRCLLHNQRYKMALPETRRGLAATASRHWKVLDAIRTGDPAAARRVIAHHVETIADPGPPATDPPAADVEVTP